ncbi:MAG: DHA2 family efflux MFS transporter permease subunit [Deltaproteobacteria bacterium]|nr:DHA2 family efflux MFS transporter permease subunit [Deltaproteobacteria bacterium]MCL5892015.1 DHA2 family efflux MFS transporter permease subunit [Deltaproteobacteria bacterium]
MENKNSGNPESIAKTPASRPKISEHRLYKWLILAISVTASFMAILDINIVIVALPKMMSHFGVNVITIDWVIIAYTITYSIIILLTSFVSKKYGLKIPFVISIIFFLVGSAFCGFAPSYRIMIIFRIIQAVGGAGLIPISVNLIAKYFKAQERGTAMGVWTIGIMVAPALGPIIGGYFVDYVDWRMIFYFNVPIGIILLLGTFILLENDIPLKPFAKKFDFVGFILIAVCLGTLLYVLNEGQTLEWNSYAIRLNELICAASFILFLIVEIFSKRHLMDYSLFKNRNFLAGNLVSMIRAGAIFSSLFLLPIFIEDILSYNAMHAGYLMAPFAAAVAVISPVAGKISDKYGPKYLLVAGMLIFAAANFSLGSMSLQTSIPFIVYNQFLRGIGVGLINAPVMMTVINSAKFEQIPDASALYNVLFQIGASFGIAWSGQELAIRQVYHLNQYAGDINYNFYEFKNVINFLREDLIKNGNSFVKATLYPSNAAKVFDFLLNEFSLIGAYGDVFFILGYLCIFGGIAALFVKNIKK